MYKLFDIKEQCIGGTIYEKDKKQTVVVAVGFGHAYDNAADSGACIKQ